MNPGIAYAALAYGVWGLFPLYFHALAGVPSIEVLLHRMVWALLAVGVILVVRRHWAWIVPTVRRPREMALFLLGALLIAGNWFVYIWAIQNAHVLDASLGYFVTPLINVLLGRFVLHERPRPAQWTAIAIAAAGVGWLAWQTGHVPWVSLVLALSFGTYGLVKKLAPTGALEALALETAILFPFAAVALLWMASQGQNAFASGTPVDRLLLIASGPITVVPLLWFAAGARRIPMTTLGLLQYIAPMLQLVLGVWVFHEPMNANRFTGYVLVWIALGLYAAESVWHYRRSRPVAGPAA